MRRVPQPMRPVSVGGRGPGAERHLARLDPIEAHQIPVFALDVSGAPSRQRFERGAEPPA